jgi:phosphatidylglycerol:prolipoprotein diacylglycerol transferase
MTVRTLIALLLYASAVTSLLGASVVAARRLELSPWRVLVFFSVLIAGFFLGARLHYLVAHRHLVIADGADGLLGKGAHMPGGIAFSILLGLAGARLLALPIARLGDALVPAFGASVLLGRLGCFVNGCCFGARTDLPWGVRFPRGTGAFTVHMTRGWLADDAAWSLRVQPTQLYFASVGLLIIAAGHLWKKVQRRPGERWLVALVVWGFANPLVESLRDPDYLTGAPHLGASGAVIAACALVGLFAWRLVTPATRQSAIAACSPIAGRTEFR